MATWLLSWQEVDGVYAVEMLAPNDATTRKIAMMINSIMAGLTGRTGGKAIFWDSEQSADNVFRYAEIAREAQVLTNDVGVWRRRKKDNQSLIQLVVI